MLGGTCYVLVVRDACYVLRAGGDATVAPHGATSWCLVPGVWGVGEL